MTDSAMNQLVVDLSQDLVAELAPQEMPVFRARSRIYLKDPGTALQVTEGSDEKLLGFGVEAGVTLLTPIILAAMQQVVIFIRDEFAEAMQEQGSAFIHEGVKSLFKKFSSTAKEAQKAPPAPPASAGAQTEPQVVIRRGFNRPLNLTKREARRIHEIVFQEATQRGLSESKAVQLADSVVSGLVVG